MRTRVILMALFVVNVLGAGCAEDASTKVDTTDQVSTITCGDLTCGKSGPVCLKFTGGLPETRPTYQCKGLPAECEKISNPSCDCVTSATWKSWNCIEVAEDFFNVSIAAP